MEFRNVYGTYKVSQCGIVIGRRGEPLSPNGNGRGYPIVKVYVGGKWTSRAVHRMVAKAWLPNPSGLPEVNHKDCDRSNFRLDNLEWCTHGYNIEYSYKTAGRSALGVNNARCNTTAETVLEICKLLAAGNSAAEVRDAGYDYSLVRAIKSRKNWSHVSSIFTW